MKKTKAKSIVFLIITLLAALYIFFEAPNLNPLYLDGAVFWATLITIYVGVGALMKIGDFSFHPEDVQPGRVPFSYSAKAKFPKFRQSHCSSMGCHRRCHDYLLGLFPSGKPTATSWENRKSKNLTARFRQSMSPRFLLSMRSLRSSWHRKSSANVRRLAHRSHCTPLPSRWWMANWSGSFRCIIPASSNG